MAQQREEWRSRVGFLLAALGAAIGLGNIWRFSYLCYKNGGGAFLIPYAIALFTAGIPLLLLEYGLGHMMRGSAVLAFRKVGRKWEWVGWWPSIFVVLGITFYYTVILAWCLDYLVYSFSLAWGGDPNNFFIQTHLNRADGVWSLGGPSWVILGGLLIIWLLNWFIEFKGVRAGIERSCKIFIPLLVGLVALLVIRGLTLPGAGEGIKWYLKPNFSALANPRVWLDAYGQIFFTLSLAMATMIAYASYLPRKAEVVGNTYLTAFGNCGFSIFAGFAVFGTLGFMAHQMGLPPEKVVKGGIGLAFVAYPQAINNMPLIPHLIGIIFFLALVVAGLSSSISQIEGMVASFMDKFGTKRTKLVGLTFAIGFPVGVFYTLRSGYYWLDIVDHYISSFSLVVVGLLECAVVGWVFGARKLREYVNEISNVKIGVWWDICIKFLVPLVLLATIVLNVRSEILKAYGGYPALANVAIGLGIVVLTFIIAMIFHARKWGQKSEGR